MGEYRRGWNYLPTPNLDALPGKLEKLFSKLDADDAQTIHNAITAILALRGGLTVIENSLATRSRPARADIKAVLNALNELETNTIEFTNSQWATQMVKITTEGQA